MHLSTLSPMTHHHVSGDAPGLAGKRLLITGANGGLGLATAVGALRAGATVIFACRTQAKADAARADALAASGAVPEHAEAYGGFDMLSPEGLEAAVDAMPEARFDVVFLQAGGWVWADEAQTVRFGGVDVEQTVAKNVLGAHATFRALLRSERLGAEARVVIIGGEGARGVPGAIARPTFEDVEDFRRYLRGDWAGRAAYKPIDALGVSKLCAALWVRHLAQEAPAGLEVLWFTPGLIGGTGGTRGLPGWKEAVFQRVAFPLLVALGQAQWPQEAARKCLDCLAGRVGRHGDLLGAPAGKAIGPLTDQLPMHDLFSDAAFQQALWSVCEDAIGPIEFSNAH